MFRSSTWTETWKMSSPPAVEEDELRRRMTLTLTIRPSLSRNTCFTAPKIVSSGIAEPFVDLLAGAAAAFVLAADEEEAAAMMERGRRLTEGDDLVETISSRGNCRWCCVLRGTAHPAAEAPLRHARMTR